MCAGSSAFLIAVGLIVFGLIAAGSNVVGLIADLIAALRSAALKTVAEQQTL